MFPGSIVFVMSGRLGLLGNFWRKLADQSSLEDQDKQQLSFFVIRFTVKYSDRLVATAVLKGPKVLDFQCLKVLGSVNHLSLRLCNIRSSCDL